MLHLGEDIRSLFPIFSRYPDLIYVDNASTVQKPNSVIHSMSEYTTNSYSNIHRGQYHLAELSESLYTESKKKVAKLIGGNCHEIVYTYNATHACNILAQSMVISLKLGPGDVVLLGIWDHHATIVPWQLLAKQFGFDLQFMYIDRETLDIDRVSVTNTIKNNNIKAVVCSHVSNVTGIVYDVVRLSGLLSDHVFFAIDGSQAVPHMQINVREIGCHAYIFTGHKMMGPTGIGVLWIEKKKGRSLQTLSGGGGIIESVSIEGCSLVRTVDKFEPGTPNLIGAIGIGAACDFYEEHSLYDYLPTYEKKLISYLEEQFSFIQGVNIVSAPLSVKCGIVSLLLDDPLVFSDKLADANICVRAGGHCAHPLLHYLSYHKALVRISVFAYNTIEEMHKIVEKTKLFI